MAVPLAETQRAGAEARYAKVGTPGVYNPGALPVRVLVRRVVRDTPEVQESAVVDRLFRLRFLQSEAPTAASGGTITISPPEEFAGVYTLGVKLDASGFVFQYQARKA